MLTEKRVHELRIFAEEIRVETLKSFTQEVSDM